MVDCRTETESLEIQPKSEKTDWVMRTDFSKRILLPEKVDVGLWSSLVAEEKSPDVPMVDVAVDADSALMEDEYEKVR